MFFSWVIGARVFKKGDLKTIQNVSGGYSMFSFDVCDYTGEIRLIAFRHQCDKYYDDIQVGKIFIISGGQVKSKNSQYSASPHDCEIIINEATILCPIVDQQDPKYSRPL